MFSACFFCSVFLYPWFYFWSIAISRFGNIIALAQLAQLSIASHSLIVALPVGSIELVDISMYHSHFGLFPSCSPSSMLLSPSSMLLSLLLSPLPSYRCLLWCYYNHFQQHHHRFIINNFIIAMISIIVTIIIIITTFFVFGLLEVVSSHAASTIVFTLTGLSCVCISLYARHVWSFLGHSRALSVVFIGSSVAVLRRAVSAFFFPGSLSRASCPRICSRSLEVSTLFFSRATARPWHLVRISRESAPFRRFRLG